MGIASFSKMRLVLAAIAVQSVAGQTFPTGVTLSCNVLDGCLGAVAFWPGKINVWWECSEGDCFWMNDPQNGQSNGAGTVPVQVPVAQAMAVGAAMPTSGFAMGTQIV